MHKVSIHFVVTLIQNSNFRKEKQNKKVDQLFLENLLLTQIELVLLKADKKGHSDRMFHITHLSQAI